MRGKKARLARRYMNGLIEAGLCTESNQDRKLSNGQIINPKRRFYRALKKEM